MEKRKHVKCIMVQGTMSDAGKSILVTALCRIFKQDGYRVMPFKSQNMALNSYITRDGLEMGRAQVAQAEAAGQEPDARMNPVLLKPSSDNGSQLIVVGEVNGNVTAHDYYTHKDELVPKILEAYYSLADEADIMVIEGAGSPAEINLKDVDIVNMGFAKLVDAPVILAGDIDRGGVFAQLYGTIELMDEEERSHIEAMVINKFRGDVDILMPGVKKLEEMTGIPVLGVVPFLDVDIDDEDSLSARLTKGREESKPIDIAVVRLPRLCNFTDFSPLEAHPARGVRYVRKASDLGDPDMVIIPGTKSTIDDLVWMRETGMEAKVLQLANRGTPVLGVCGGYQMLGEHLVNPEHLEGPRDEIRGMGLLPTETVFKAKKRRTRFLAEVKAPMFKGAKLDGYEIHMGITKVLGDPFLQLESGEYDGCVKGNVFGTYLHGLFDTGDLTQRLADLLLERKGVDASGFRPESHKDYKEEQYDKLADGVRKVLDIEKIYEIMDKYDRKYSE